jgi:hypothetical protein
MSDSDFGPVIKTGPSDSVLASLFRTILMDLGITAIRFEKLLDKYIIQAKLPNNIKDASSQRGNLRKELLKTTMTWKVFIKGLMFLNVIKFDISVKLYHPNGRLTEHIKTVRLDRDMENIEDILTQEGETDEST